jgi:ectoine hydroxylase-related dioxygenase (phytanoyl-CoA dioxygenase family)
MTGAQVFRNILEYTVADLAGTFPSTAGSQPKPPDGVADEAMRTLERDGYVVFEKLIPDPEIEAIRADVIPRLHPQPGRNNFEGFATQRLYAVLEKTFACNALVEHPIVLALLDRIFEPNYLLSALQVINILPGEAQQPIHYDDAFYPWPRPRRALGAATVFAIDDFTSENGATVVIPGSHVWADRLPTDAELASAKSIVMPKGSMLFFLGTLWHSGGANRSPSPRACVTAQYCAPWCRQQENFSLSISRERVRMVSEHIQRMLGYSVHRPFMGFVNGMHPKRLLQP